MTAHPPRHLKRTPGPTSGQRASAHVSDRAPASPGSSPRRAARPAAGHAESRHLAPDSLAQALLEAAAVVLAVREGSSLPLALARHARTAGLRPQVQDLAYGTLRRFGWGDFILDQLLSQPLNAVLVHQLLLAALYRLETRPESSHTVVDQAVEAAGAMVDGKFRSLVNGVLRNYLRRRDELHAEARRQPVALWQHPLWWIERLRAAWPEHAEAILEAGNRPPPMTLRVNRRRTDRTSYAETLKAAGLTALPVGEDGLRLTQAVGVESLPGFSDGWVSVQDAGAQEACLALDFPPGCRVLDACAAPGGKTAHVLERHEVALTALEVDGERARRLNDTLTRLGLSAQVITADVTAVKTWWDGQPFDRILADVPCSGSGVVSRHPDAKWLKRPSDLRQLVGLQARILDALWPTLKAGGRLLYVTCSVFPQENQDQIRQFVRQHADARWLALGEGLPDKQLFPSDEHDGFYFALLEKMGAA